MQLFTNKGIPRSLPTFLQISVHKPKLGLCHSLIVGSKAHTSMQVRCCCSCEDSELQLIQCDQKERDLMFCVISSTKLWRFRWNLVHRFQNKFAANHVNLFHLTWIMSLHYLVKPQMLVGHVLPLSCSRNSKIYLTSTVAPKFESSWLQHVGTIARGVKEYASVIWTNWNSDWKLGGPSWIMSSLRQPFVRGSGVVDSSRSLMRVLYTVSCNISHALLSTGFKSGEFGGHSCSGINSGVSFSKNSVAARAQLMSISSFTR